MQRSSAQRWWCPRHFGAGTLPTDEVGGSVVSFLLVLPVLLTFLFAVVDLGRTVFLNMALEDAAFATCRVACASAEQTSSEAELRAAALSASPALGGEGLALTARVQQGDPVAEERVLRIFDEEQGAFAEYPAQTAHRTVRIELVLEGTYLTPVGSLIATASGREDATFAYVASVAGEADETLREGVV